MKEHRNRQPLATKSAAKQKKGPTTRAQPEDPPTVEKKPVYQKGEDEFISSSTSRMSKVTSKGMH